MKRFRYIITTTILLLICFCSEAQTDQNFTNGIPSAQITFTGALCSYNWVNDNPAIGLPAKGNGDIASFIPVNTGNTPITATITATPAVSGMAYITNGYANTVSVINLATNSVLKTFPVGDVPVGVAVSPATNCVYVSNSFGGSVSVINSLTNTVTATIKVGSYPYSLCASPDGSRVYVGNVNDGNVSVINTATNAVIKKIPAGKGPLCLVTNADGTLLYVTNYDSNANSNNTAGTVTVINTVLGAIVTTIPVGIQPWGITASKDGAFVYVCNEVSNSVSVINTVTNTVTSTIPVGYYPVSPTVSPDGKLLYTRDGSTNRLLVTDIATRQAIASAPLGGVGSIGLSISPDGKRVLVVNQVSGSVTVVDAENNSTITTVSVPAGSSALGMGNFILGDNNCGPVKFKITVNPSPAISTTNALLAQSTIYGTPSVTGIFNVSGTWLTSDIIIKAPSGFEISTDNANFSNTVNLTPSNGSINDIPVYIRLAALTPVGSYSGDIVLSANGAANANIAVPAGNVTPAMLQVKINDQSRYFGDPNPVLTATYTGFVNNENLSNISAVPLINTAATPSSPIGKYPITASGGTADNYLFTYQDGVLTVNPLPAISIIGALSALSTTYGTPSVTNTFKVSGAWLQSSVLITAPQGFEISTNNVSFSNNITLTPSGGSIVAMTIYIRLAALTPVGNYSGNVVLSSSKAADATFAVPAGNVIPAVLEVKVNNQNRYFGDPNPVLTATYTGFVNNEGLSNLKFVPLISTVAVPNSPIGKYPIIASGGAADNYIFNYEEGTLTVDADTRKLVIPNAFTPNGDGINDVWNIQNLNGSTDIVVEIFNRNGQLVYYSIGYNTPWDGRYKNSDLPAAVYYYVINSKKSVKILSGYVLLSR
jgi:gliding motility-associated-like protein